MWRFIKELWNEGEGGKAVLVMILIQIIIILASFLIMLVPEPSKNSSPPPDNDARWISSQERPYLQEGVPGTFQER